MVTYAYKCPNPNCKVDELEEQRSIKEQPPSWIPCECGAAAERVWNPTEFICERADKDAGR